MPCPMTRRLALPRIDDLHADQRNAMVNDAGEAFYPDGPEDAAWFANEHGARFVHDDPFGPWGDR